VFDYTEGGKATDLKLTSAEQTSLSISWQCDVKDATFELELSMLDKKETFTTSDTTKVFNDLTPGTEYTVTVYTKKTEDGKMQTIGIAEATFSTSK